MSRPAEATVLLGLPDGPARAALRAGLMAMRLAPTPLPSDRRGRDTVLQGLADKPRAVAFIDISRGSTTLLQLDAILPRDTRRRIVLTRLAAGAGLGHVSEADRRWVRRLGFADLIPELDAMDCEGGLRDALDQGHFVLHYQPKQHLASGAIAGAEALIRWNDPRRGLVPPAQFIPILEETGLIYDVGRWALRQALADNLRWRQAGLAPLRVAVNVSYLQLRHRGFIAEVRDAVSHDAGAAAGLELEITESMVMDDVQHSTASLHALREMGITIAIDDFGTGFSSLSYLGKLPVDTLKIDRSFILNMASGPQGVALVSTIINLGHSLGLKVVAEGVETEDQSRHLALLGCDQIQGYLLSKPVPAEVFEAQFLHTLMAK